MASWLSEIDVTGDLHQLFAIKNELNSFNGDMLGSSFQLAIEENN